jgi:hypothetical protein
MYSRKKCTNNKRKKLNFYKRKRTQKKGGMNLIQLGYKFPMADSFDKFILAFEYMIHNPKTAIKVAKYAPEPTIQTIARLLEKSIGIIEQRGLQIKDMTKKILPVIDNMKKFKKDNNLTSSVAIIKFVKDPAKLSNFLKDQLNTIQNAVNDLTQEPESEPVAEEVAEPVAEEVAEEVAEPVAEEVAEPVAEEVAEPVAEEVAEPEEPVEGGNTKRKKTRRKKTRRKKTRKLHKKY